MGLFDKKFCDICGEKIGLLGNRKLEDGNCCKDCAAKLSPWFDERRHSTVAQIKEQLAYREENKKAVSAFRVSKTFGEGTQLRIDEAQKKFMVAKTTNYANENPDVIDLSQVTNCVLDIDESKSELKTKDAEGKSVSYNPPQFAYDYDFYIVISVNHPWFDTIKFKLNRNHVSMDTMVNGQPVVMMQPFNPRMSAEYQRYEAMGAEVVAAVLGRPYTPPAPVQQPVMQQPVQPGYQPPMQPGYQQPVQPGYQPPMQPGYQQPVQPGYQQPVQPGYQQPVQPGYQPPMQPGYQQPVQPGYQQPVQPGYQQPVQPGYQQPVQPGYQQPIQPGVAGVVGGVAGVVAGQQPVAGPWVCPACGAQNQNPASRFCEFCGAARQ